MKDADDDTRVVQRRDCAIAGQEGAPVFVLIHGARLTRAMWQPQIEIGRAPCRERV